MTEKAPHAFRTISEAADALGVPQHVLRFWESKFTFLRPMKRAGGRRFYRPQDLTLLRGIEQLLRQQGYTIRGVQKRHREQGLQPILSAAEQHSLVPLERLQSQDVSVEDINPDNPVRMAAEIAEGIDPLKLRAETRYALEVVLHDIEKARKKLERVMDACMGDLFAGSEARDLWASNGNDVSHTTPPEVLSIKIRG